MPSPKDPLSTISPGPGKLPAGTVSASSLLFVSGGGGGVGLLAHITDPTDAHMASAIGVNPYYPPGGTTPVLASVGGPVDGESVLDFINQARDLFPTRPNKLGFNDVAIPNSGLMDWDEWSGANSVTGGYTDAPDAVLTHFLVPVTSTTPGPYSKFYPADRGVLAVYRSTDGDFTNAGTTTLYAALWLGATANKPVALTCPSANFDENLRSTAQPDYLPSLVGLDQIAMTARTGARTDVATVPPLDVFSFNFFAYQLGVWGVTMPAVVAGSNDSWLVVQWKESYAVSNAAIAPAAMLVNYSGTNVYSAVPPDYDAIPVDTAGVQSLNRRNVYRDALSAVAPVQAAWTTTPAGSLFWLSGVQQYSTLSWNFDVRVTNLANNSWLSGQTAGAELPAAFVSTEDPIEYDFAAFGGGTLGRAYYQLRQTGGVSTYTMAAAPAPGDQIQDLSVGVAIPTPAPHTPVGGTAQIVGTARKPWASAALTQTTLFLFNSWDQTAPSTSSTATFEPFRDERFRYKSSVVFLSTLAVEPNAGDLYDGTVVLLAGTTDAQVIGDRVVYPQVDYSGPLYAPTGANYATVLAGDPALHVRSFLRAFDTGLPRNTGRIRVRGLALIDFTAGSYTGVVGTDHPGGVVLAVRVPGQTAWLDLGLTRGTPNLDTSVNYHGCQTGVEVDGPDIIVSYNTTALTGDNGAGDFPLFFSVGLIKGAGTAKLVDEIEWLAP